jgi:hypothetical protein
MSDPFWLLKPPYTLLDAGMFVLFLAAFYTYTGKAYIRFHGWVYRAYEPKRYWWEVVTCYLGGVVLIMVFIVYLLHAHAPSD